MSAGTESGRNVNYQRTYHGQTIFKWWPVIRDATTTYDADGNPVTTYSYRWTQYTIPAHIEYGTTGPPGGTGPYAARGFVGWNNHHMPDPTKIGYTKPGATDSDGTAYAGVTAVDEVPSTADGTPVPNSSPKLSIDSNNTPELTALLDRFTTMGIIPANTNCWINSNGTATFSISNSYRPIDWEKTLAGISSQSAPGVILKSCGLTD